MKKINGTPVMVVEYIDSLSTPSYGEYSHPAIIRTTPCISRGQKLFDLRSKATFTPDRPYTTWDICAGTVLRYPDGKNILVTRYLFGEQEMAMMPICKRKFRSTLILRSLIDRKQEENA